MFSKSSKRQPNIVQWSRKDAYGAKPFLQLRYTKIVHLGPKHKFCIFLHAEGFLNASRDNQTTFRDQWSRMDAFGAKHFHNFGTPR
jgi:hypothetical protein